MKAIACNQTSVSQEQSVCKCPVHSPCKGPATDGKRGDSWFIPVSSQADSGRETTGYSEPHVRSGVVVKAWRRTEDGDLAQLPRAPIGFQEVVVQMAVAVWHVEECGASHSILA